jgi:hypothetical protein
LNRTHRTLHIIRQLDRLSLSTADADEEPSVESPASLIKATFDEFHRAAPKLEASAQQLRGNAWRLDALGRAWQEQPLAYPLARRELQRLHNDFGRILQAVAALQEARAERLRRTAALYRQVDETVADGFTWIQDQLGIPLALPVRLAGQPTSGADAP